MSPMNQGEWGMACGIPQGQHGCVTLAHGEGGRVSRALIRDRIIAKLQERSVQLLFDAADVGAFAENIAVTTDSYVVSPIFFAGGDIGSLAVYGTVNDLAMAGATPMFLTLALILEEGFPLETLDRVIDSVARSALECDVKIVAGDTKVVPKGAADGVFINTTGIGRFQQPRMPGSRQITPGDSLIFSASIARHGLAILDARESFGFSPSPATDSGPLHQIAEALRIGLGCELRSMRDATRGGVAAVLHEWAEDCGHAMWIDEAAVPLSASTRGICELLGLDPLFIANEGTFVAAVAPNRCSEALAILHRFSRSREACKVGEVRNRVVSPVVVRRVVGFDQPLDEPLGAMLPRIC